LPWLAVAYGAGIVLYFTAEREPRVWAAVTLVAVCAAIAVVLRRHAAGFVVALGVLPRWPSALLRRHRAARQPTVRRVQTPPRRHHRARRRTMPRRSRTISKRISEEA
jgi:competence protein ComEC